MESPFCVGTNSQLDACRQQNVNKLRHVRRVYSTSTCSAHQLQTTLYTLPHSSHVFFLSSTSALSLTVFLITGQPMPSPLIRILLQIGGIERNPGPQPTWICSVCNGTINCGHKYVLCSRCKGWCHVRQSHNCSQLASTKLWSDQYVWPVHLHHQHISLPHLYLHLSKVTLAPDQKLLRSCGSAAMVSRRKCWKS